MKIEKLPSGNYRVRKTYKGKTYTLHFTKKPTEKEVLRRMSTELEEQEKRIDGTFEHFAIEYVKSRDNILSPSSITTYNRLIKVISDDFKALDLYDITQSDVQKEINRYAENHEPKTVRSLHGFISAVFASYRPQLVLRTTLPQKKEKERYLPTESDIKAILDMAKGTEDSVAIQLGVLSLRRGEICALEMSDLNGNELHIHSTMVWLDGSGWIKKETPKTDAGNRTIYLPATLVSEIEQTGYFFKYSPNKLAEHLHIYQDKLNIPRFRFHDLRHYFASYASSIMPESDSMALGVWKSDFVFKQIYRESMKDKRKASAELFNNSIFN